MKLLTNEQICEKVLGWRPIKGAIDTSYVGSSSVVRTIGWQKTDGDKILGTPPFLTDLQACFDYILPMLHKRGLTIRINSNGTRPIEIDIYDPNIGLYCSENEEPAPAFIEALSKWWEDQST